MCLKSAVKLVGLGMALVLVLAATSAIAQQDCTGDITTRVFQLLRSNTDGTVGLYLKEVGGSVLAACNERTVFEPASTIKVVHHLHAMLQVQSGSVVRGSVVTLETPITWFSFFDTTNGTSCPGDLGPFVDPLRNVLREMLWRSDNRHTQAIRVYFGQENINATAQAIGMKDTALNHRIGCVFGPDGGVTNPNRLTLYDAGLLYEKVAEGSLLTPEHKQTFYALMPGKEFDSSGVWRDIQRMIEAEAPASMTAQQKQSFTQQVDTRYKAGNYTFCTPQCLYYHTIAGWAQIPFCSEGKVVSRQYVFGLFIHKATVPGNTLFALTRAELLREQLRAALQTYAVCPMD